MFLIILETIVEYGVMSDLSNQSEKFAAVEEEYLGKSLKKFVKSRRLTMYTLNKESAAEKYSAVKVQSE